MKYHDPKHPIWPLARFLVAGIVLTVVLAFNATHFDETEARAITAFLMLYGGGEVGARFLQKRDEE